MAKTAPQTNQAVEIRRVRLLGAALFLCYAYFFYLGGNWNVESRHAQIYALAERGTLVVDSYPFLPPGGGDAARFEGHYYSDKLVGPSLVAVPFYLPLRYGLSAAGLDLRRAVYFSLRLTNLITNAFPSALLGGALYLFLAHLGLSSGLRVWLALAYGLGTLAFPYSTLLFGHQLAAVAVGFAFMLLWLQRAEWSSRRALIAGALLGFAAMSDVMGLFLAVVLGVYAASVAARHGAGRSGIARRLAAPTFLGLGIFSIQLIANWSSFGSPLTFPHVYHAQAAFRARHTAGLFGIHLPQLYPLYQLTVGPWRGLFCGSPVLLLALPGVVLLGRKWRAEAVTIAVSYLVVLLVHSGYENWTTGSAYGPRYQIVALPLLVIAVGPAAQRWPFVLKTLSLISIAFTAIVTVTSPLLPEDLRNPLANALAQFAAGNLQHANLGSLVGLAGVASLLPLGVAMGALLAALRLAGDKAAS